MMNLSQNHSLDKAEAKKRLEKLADCLKSEYGICVDWNGDQAHLKGQVKGFNVDVQVTVNDSSVEAVGDDSSLGFMAKNATKIYLKGKLASCLDASKTLDDITA